MITTYVTEVNSENFSEKINSTEKTLIYIKASWCGPCKQLSPTIDEVSSELGQTVTICKMDADENRDTCQQLGIRSIPTIIIFKDGQIVEKHTGMIQKPQLMSLLEKHV